MSEPSRKSARYIGPSPRVTVAVGNVDVYCDRDKDAEFPAEIADELCKQADWELVTRGGSSPLKADLVKQAGDLHLEIPAKATKADIAALIETAGHVPGVVAPPQENLTTGDEGEAPAGEDGNDESGVAGEEE